MIVVTGGAGFIGSNIVRGLNNRGYRNILIADNLENGMKHKNLNRLDFTDYVDYRDFITNLDFYGISKIFHQGACSCTTEQNGRYMMDVNYEYSKKLWEFAMRKGIGFIYASSASVYGDGKNGFIESAACEYPLNVYAFSKYQFDRYLRRHWHKATSQTVALRYYNVYGPQENHKGSMASVAFHLYNQAKNGGPLKLFKGSDGFKRDFIHVDDVVNVNMFFLDNPELSGIYNCGTGTAESFMEIANTIQSFFSGVQIELVDFPAELEGKYQAYTCADMSALYRDGYCGEFMDVNTGVTNYLEILETSGGYLI